MVERFTSYVIMMAIDGYGLTADPQGEFVRHSDYEALEAELAAAKTALERKVNEKIAEVKARKTAESRLSEMEKEVERLRAWKAEALKALEPFSEAASEWDAEPADLHVFFEWNDEKKPVPSLPVADFRAARRLVEGGGKS